MKEELYEYILKTFGGAATTFSNLYKGNIPLQQMPDEIAACLSKIQKKKVKSYLEIGSGQGGSAYLMNEYFDLFTLVMVDVEPDPQRLERLPDAIEIIGDSKSPGVIDRVLKHCPYDLVLIDGDHTYEGVVNDFVHYEQMLNTFGHVLFHDTRSWPGVRDFMPHMMRHARYHFSGEFLSAIGTPQGLCLFQKIK